MPKVYSEHDKNAKTLSEKAKDMHHLHSTQAGSYCIPESSRCLLTLKHLKPPNLHPSVWLLSSTKYYQFTTILSRVTWSKLLSLRSASRKGFYKTSHVWPLNYQKQRKDGSPQALLHKLLVCFPIWLVTRYSAVPIASPFHFIKGKIKVVKVSEFTLFIQQNIKHTR